MLPEHSSVIRRKPAPANVTGTQYVAPSLATGR
jgi:hypothetical protein